MSVKNIIAVSSCKGGVGKSTIATNLAFTLSKQLGKSVGILDADLYGPSVPFLLSQRNSKTYYSDPENKVIAPINFENVKTISMGYTNNDQKAVIRGPIASQIIREFYLNVDWGDLDYLIIDMPPGTHDIHLTLAQELEIDAAVIVTTPQNLSYLDVIKGIDTLEVLGVPSIALIENMSYFVCDSCDEKHRIFGESKIEGFRKQFGIEKAFEVGVYADVGKINDQGLPFSLVLPEHHYVNLKMTEIASGIVEELEKTKSERSVFEYRNDENKKLLEIREVKENSGEILEEIEVSFLDLRRHCRCALCEDEITGQRVVPIDSKHSKGIFYIFNLS